MKTYINIPKETKVENTTSWKNTIIANIATKNPWLTNTWNGTYNEPSYINSDYYDIKTTVAKPKTISFSLGDLSMFDSYISDISKIKMNMYGIPYYDDSYDFKDIFGNKVKIFDNFIKIGYDIIPRNLNLAYFNTLIPEKKKVIIEIIIKLKNYSF